MPPPIFSPAHRAAAALRRAERALRNWQDDPDSPRRDVDNMISTIGEMRAWVHAHILQEIEPRAHDNKEI